ncbi:MAG: DUF302 domain-containing protein [Ornithinimicrobium sp.]
MKTSTASRFAAAALVAVAWTLTPLTARAAEAPDVPGLVVYSSEHDVPGTVERVQDALSEAGMVTLTLDHQSNAESVGMQLRPTTVVIGGAPKIGTPLLLEQQEVGVDLPQKFLAWQDADGEVWLAYNSAEYVATQAGIDPGSTALTGLEQGSAGIAATASGSQTPANSGAPVTRYPDYLLDQPSDATVEETISRYRAAFSAADLARLPAVDHAAGARTVDAELRPTQVVYAGNPAVGTPLIAAEQTMGIDLPTRYLAWADETGDVRAGHVNVDRLAQRHGVTGVDEVLAKVTTGTATFTAAAAGVAPQVSEPPAGGVGTGGGDTSGLEHGGALVLSAAALLTGAIGLVWSRRRGESR